MLETLRIAHIRCHTTLELGEFQRLNLLIGPNGKGKTSVLEALYLLARCRSFRTSHLRDVLQWQAPFLRAEATFGEAPHKLAFAWSAPGKRVLTVGNLAETTLHEYWGQCTAVVFQNRDLALVQDRAQARRQWFDGLIASAEPAYLPLVQRLQRVLRERNALLRLPSPDRALFDVLSDQLAALSEEITATRQRYTDQLAPLLCESLHTLTDRREHFEILYDSHYERHREMTRDHLFERERRLGATLTGPQRDDWQLLLEGQPLRAYGSEGQQRSAALALRFAETSLLCAARGHAPLLLLDDILHELDPARRERFWHLIPADAQIFLATTREPELPPASSPHTIHLE